MRFMLMIKGDAECEAGLPPAPRLTSAIAQLTEEMRRAGAVLAIESLAPSASGARIYASGGKLSILDGPFTETKELVGVLALVQAASMQEAIEHGWLFMKIHQEVLGSRWEGQVEIREVQEVPGVQEVLEVLRVLEVREVH
jgi:hypothetical protein